MKKFNPEIWLHERREFDPSRWMPQQQPVKNKPVQASSGTMSKFEEVEIVVSRIEAAQLDLTCNYADWVKLCYSLVDEFGENGRSFFHRISRFFPGYDRTTSDNQFDKCLKSNNRSGSTIKSLFSAAYDAGIDVRV